ncbi:hypothetical protein HAX54_050856 [Datura stramonium]|uniref:Ubiquinol oxidase n=1 Tax=Datura stramonium TaxID=4076 RepID=A0ABS8SX04_DATST|nr:hypothetical protein [Datura stramonium]
MAHVPCHGTRNRCSRARDGRQDAPPLQVPPAIRTQWLMEKKPRTSGCIPSRSSLCNPRHILQCLFGVPKIDSSDCWVFGGRSGEFVCIEFLVDIEKGPFENLLAPAIDIDYWRLPADSTLKDVVTVIRADEAHHRYLNHFASVRFSSLLILARTVDPRGLVFL